MLPYEVIATHLGFALRFKDKASIQRLIDELQVILDENDTGPPYIHMYHSNLSTEDNFKLVDWYTDVLKYERKCHDD